MTKKNNTITLLVIIAFAGAFFAGFISAPVALLGVAGVAVLNRFFGHSPQIEPLKPKIVPTKKSASIPVKTSSSHPKPQDPILNHTAAPEALARKGAASAGLSATTTSSYTASTSDDSILDCHAAPRALTRNDEASTNAGLSRTTMTSTLGTKTPEENITEKTLKTTTTLEAEKNPSLRASASSDARQFSMDMSKEAAPKEDVASTLLLAAAAPSLLSFHSTTRTESVIFTEKPYIETIPCKADVLATLQKISAEELVAFLKTNTLSNYKYTNENYFTWACKESQKKITEYILNTIPNEQILDFLENTKFEEKAIFTDLNDSMSSLSRYRFGAARAFYTENLITWASKNSQIESLFGLIIAKLNATNIKKFLVKNKIHSNDMMHSQSLLAWYIEKNNLSMIDGILSLAATPKEKLDLLDLEEPFGNALSSIKIEIFTKNPYLISQLLNYDLASAQTTDKQESLFMLYMHSRIGTQDNINCSFFKELLKNSKNSNAINIKNKNNKTVLHIAIENSQARVAYSLLENGADIALLNEKEQEQLGNLIINHFIAKDSNSFCIGLAEPILNTLNIQIFENMLFVSSMLNVAFRKNSYPIMALILEKVPAHKIMDLIKLIFIIDDDHYERPKESLLERIISQSGNAKTQKIFSVILSKIQIRERLLLLRQDEKQISKIILNPVETNFYQVLDSPHMSGKIEKLENKALSTNLLFLCCIFNTNENQDVITSKVNNLLKNYQADINATSSKGQTALHYAIENKNKKLIRQLLHSGADVRLLDVEKQKYLIEELGCGHFQALSILLSKKGLQINTYLLEIYKTITLGHIDMLKLFTFRIEKANQNKKEKEQYPLQNTSYNIKPIGSKISYNFLTWALKQIPNPLPTDNQSAITEYLDQYSIPRSVTSLITGYLFANPHIEIMRHLLKKVQINRDIMKAIVNRGQQNLLPILFSNHEKRPETERSFALQAAAGYGNETVVRFLLEKPDINLHCTDKEHRLPALTLAVRNKFTGIVSLLHTAHQAFSEKHLLKMIEVKNTLIFSDIIMPHQSKPAEEAQNALEQDKSKISIMIMEYAEAPLVNDLNAAPKKSLSANP